MSMLKRFPKTPWAEANQIHHHIHLPDRNVRYIYDDGKTDLRDSLSVGWDVEESILSEAINPNELEQGMALLQKDWDRYKERCAMDKPEGVKEESYKDPETGNTVKIPWDQWQECCLAAFEFLRVKDGKLIEPIALGGTCNRRFAVIVEAAAIALYRYRLALGDMKAQFTDEVFPRIVNAVSPDTPSRRFPDEATRREALVAENRFKGTGAKALELREELKVARDFLEKDGRNQSYLRNFFGTSQGYPMYFACRFDRYCKNMGTSFEIDAEERKRWLSIDFLERLTAPKYTNKANEEAGITNPRFLPFSPAPFDTKTWQGGKTKDGGDLLPMGPMTDLDSVFEKENRKREKQGKDLYRRPESAQEAIDWVTKVSQGKKVKIVTPMKKPQLDKIKDAHPNLFVKQAMRAVVEDSTEFLQTAQDRHEVCNFVFGCPEETYDALRDLVGQLMLVDNDQQVELIKEFKELMLRSDVQIVE
jgi:hypothetical protein